jgi:transcriptional regulator with XRE-family HTH domain
MTYCMSCGGAKVESKVVPVYEAEGLGAPFKVFLANAVKVETCGECGSVQGTYIPDMEGLLHAVVFERAIHSRKLTGEEIRFMRRSMGWKAKDLAKHLDMTPEHLSRCEAGARVMAPSTEKLFRIYVIVKTPDKAALAELDLTNLFDMIEIDATWDATASLAFCFHRRPVAAAEPCNDDDGGGKWRKAA